MKRNSVRIILVVLALPILLILGAGVFAAADALAFAGSQQFHSDEKDYAVLYPDDVHENELSPGELPAVLLIHEWWGLNEDHMIKAQALAAQGYVVYAPDAYGGKLAQTVPGALFLTFTQSSGEIYSRIDDSYADMIADPLVDPERTAVAGFCFGGRQAMMLGIRNDQPAATVTFYGSGLVTDPDEQGSLGENGPVLGIFGEEDASIPLEEVAEFKSALEIRNVEYEQEIYPGVGHAFVKAGELNGPGASARAWRRFLGFLEAEL